MHARSPNNAGFLLIAAISGRALAAAARRAGYRPLVADFFCDTDTVALAERTRMLPGDLQHGIDMGKLVTTLRQLAGSDRPAALVLGSGFEREPAIVDEVARHFPLAGNSGAAIQRVKDPQTLAADCAELGIPHPEFRRDAPPDPENWVVKTAGGAGGAHVRRVNGTEFQLHSAAISSASCPGRAPRRCSSATASARASSASAGNGHPLPPTLPIAMAAPCG